MMEIAIIGAGNIGSALARKLVAAGHTVRMANSRGPETIAELAGRIGAQAASGRAAVEGADVVILSIPFGRLPQLKGIVSALPRRVVVADTSNYFPVRDGRIAAVEEGEVESLWVSAQLGRPVVKAWNNVLAQVLDGTVASPQGRTALSVAGDDAPSKQVVMSLVEQTGFDAIDGGALAESWRQQPITGAYCAELSADDLRTALATADRRRAPLLREAMVEKYVAMADITPEDIVRLHRAASAKARTRSYSGGCACGAVRYETAHAPIFQNHCQCRDCQKRSGTGHGSYLTFPARDEMTIRGDAAHWQVAADNGNVKTHGFCPTCGTSVYLRFAAAPDLIAVPAGSLDEPGRFVPEALTYGVRAQAWDRIDPALVTFERMPTG